MSRLERFTGAAYDPGAWADLFARAGAEYAVLTSRHLDGVVLGDTFRDASSPLAPLTRTPNGPHAWPS
jgi:alpha-L-fucosidase